MQRLNIPFKSSQTTTRPNRRVVSTSSLAALLIILLVWAGVRMIAGRSTLLGFVPKDAEVIDVIGRGALLNMAEQFGDVPLLAGRPLTLSSILPNVRGEAELILLTNGSRVLAYRGVLSEGDEQTYKGYGLFVKKIGRSVLVASQESDFAVLGDGGTHFGVSAALPGFAGFWHEQGKTFGLYAGKNGLRTGFVTIFAERLPDLPSNTVAFTRFSQGDQAISAYVYALLGSGVSSSMQALLSGNDGDLLITSDEAGIGYRLTVNNRIDSQILAKVLLASAALASPTTKTVALPDGSYVDELEANPAGVAMGVEELADGVIVKADQGDLHLRAQVRESETVITNRELLLENVSKEDRLVLACGLKAQSLVLPIKLADVLKKNASTDDVLLSAMSKVEELLILDKKFSICW